MAGHQRKTWGINFRKSSAKAQVTPPVYNANLPPECLNQHARTHYDTSFVNHIPSIDGVTRTYTSIGKRRVKDDDDYFNEEEEPRKNNLEYIPAPNSLSSKVNNDDVSEDPLDAYMNQIDVTIIKCPICLINIDYKKDIIKIGNCKHEFCTQCLVTWLKVSTKCPMDRQDIHNVDIVSYKTIQSTDVNSFLKEKMLTIWTESIDSISAHLTYGVRTINDYMKNKEIVLEEEYQKVVFDCIESLERDVNSYNKSIDEWRFTINLWDFDFNEEDQIVDDKYESIGQLLNKILNILKYISTSIIGSKDNADNTEEDYDEKTMINNLRSIRADIMESEMEDMDLNALLFRAQCDNRCLICELEIDLENHAGFNLVEGNNDCLDECNHKVCAQCMSKWMIMDMQCPFHGGESYSVVINKPNEEQFHKF